MNTTEKFRVLIQLALVDNQFESAEKSFIEELAGLNKISSDTLQTLINEELAKKDGQRQFEIPTDFTTKIELLADMVRIMKADGKVYFSEIKFCKMMAKMFGFKEKSIGLLSGMVHQDPAVATDWNTIAEKMKNMAA